MGTKIKADPACRGCFYLGLTGMYETCDFFVITGRRRGCPGGKGCKEYHPKKRDHAARLFRDYPSDAPKNDGTATAQSKEVRNTQKKRNRPPTKLDEEKAMELYRQGHNDKDIASRLGMSAAGIHNWRKRNGLPVIAPQKRIDDHNEQVMALYKQGLTDSAIGEAVGFSATIVRRWRLRRGLPATHQQGWPTK